MMMLKAQWLRTAARGETATATAAAATQEWIVFYVSLPLSFLFQLNGFVWLHKRDITDHALTSTQNTAALLLISQLSHC